MVGAEATVKIIYYHNNKTIDIDVNSVTVTGCRCGVEGPPINTRIVGGTEVQPVGCKNINYSSQTPFPLHTD